MKQLILMQILKVNILGLLNITLNYTLKNTVAVPAQNADSGILKNATIAVPLNYLSNFWRSIEMLLINCRVELRVIWAKHCFVCSWLSKPKR